MVCELDCLGNSGTTNAVFTVSLSNPSSQTSSVNYATANITATLADNDYQSASGTLTFAPGQTTQTITVLVNGDTKFEPNEFFRLILSNATNSFIADSQAIGTIVNDDLQPSISINDVTVTEGNSGTVSAVFTVSLGTLSSQTITVNYATADATATLADNDYQSTSGTLTFTPGQATQTITVLVNGDTKFEPNETFQVNLSNPTNGTISDSQSIGTILNDDSAPSISIEDVSVTEGNSGTTPVVSTVNLTVASARTLTLRWATADGTATVADNDYVATNGTLTFAPGVTSLTITNFVNGDTVNEPDETFLVRLSTLFSFNGSTGDETTFQPDGQSANANVSNISRG